MLYIGRFTTTEEDHKLGPWYGSFTCLVEADKPEDAVDKFEQYLRKIRESGNFFSRDLGSGHAKYLKNCKKSFKNSRFLVLNI